MTTERVEYTQEEILKTTKWEPRQVEYYDYVISHGNCPDGDVAAWVYYFYVLTFGDREKLEKIHFIKMPAGKYPTEIHACFRNKKLLLLDYSFKRQEFINVSEIVKELVMLDHHRSAVTETKDLILPNIQLNIDESRCGAQMTWDYFFTNEPRPFFIEVVADRDLWKNEYPNSRQFGAYFHHKGIYYNFDELTELFIEEYSVEDKDYTLNMLSVGQTYMDMEEKNIQTSVKYAMNRTLTTPSGKTYNIMISMCSHAIASDVGNRLAKMEGIDFAICYRYYFESDSWNFSCRGIGKVNLSELTKEYGGGGHVNSAGFELKNSANILQTTFPSIIN